MKVSIRPLASSDEYHACEALQGQVWGMEDDLDVVPLHMLLTVQRHGGVLLGAFHGDELIGFVFGFAGLTGDGKLKHCSHMMGVAARYQTQGVGHQLKLAQREQVLKQGLDLVTWTYDPLESRNAYLNINKLGAVSRTYIQDLYGPMHDGLNAGLPSDRFQVEWWVASGRVRRCLEGEATPLSPDSLLQANVTGTSATGLLTPGSLRVGTDLPPAPGLDGIRPDGIRVEIPADYQRIKALDSGLALEWRMVTRQIFEACFAAGYTVVDFISHRTEAGRRSYYVLRPGPVIGI